MANPFKEAEKKNKKTPGDGGREEHRTVEQPVVEEIAPPPAETVATDTLGIPLANLVPKEKKPQITSTSLYLSDEANEKLEKLAKMNKTSKSKALDALLKNLPL